MHEPEEPIKEGTGRSPVYIFGIWMAIAVISGLAALAGYSIFGSVSPEAFEGSTICPD